MRTVTICRTATVTALGDGIDNLWHGLLAGRSGIAPLSLFDCGNYNSGLAGEISDLRTAAGESRIDPLLERLAAQLGGVPADCRLLLASTKGEIDRFDAACRAGIQVPATCMFEPLLAKISGRFALRDGGSNLNAACASSPVALARGAALIAAGQAEAVLVCGVDILSEFVFSGFSALQALSPEPCRPFDRQRCGLNLGEAAVALLLMSEDRARRDGETILARLVGWGASNDANHVTAPARDGSGLIRACRQALHCAELEPQAIAAVNAHGTATVFNDAMELTAFNTLFEGVLPPLHGIKGSLGHCLGAAGGVEVAVACRALQSRLLPGTVGCVNPEETAAGAISIDHREFEGDYMLSTNSGFGGVNAALILQREEP